MYGCSQDLHPRAVSRQVHLHLLPVARGMKTLGVVDSWEMLRLFCFLYTGCLQVMQCCQEIC